MAKLYRKAAPGRAKRINRDHGGVPQLAAQISGRSLTMVYKVIYGHAKSAVVEHAIESAKRQLKGARRRAA
jgi:hypothetical protein